MDFGMDKASDAISTTAVAGSINEFSTQSWQMDDGTSYEIAGSQDECSVRSP